ncbi:MAG TPA: radical SAM protein, partial [Myxococcota bacterium]|nr:radical SAM protein [Myxococcota bacterium]
MAGPRPLVANPAGEIVDLAGLRAAARAGAEVFPLDPAELVPLPEASELLFLPGRRPLGLGAHGAEPIPDALAVAAFLPPGWTALALAA